MAVDPPSALITAAFRWVDGHADLWAVFSDPAVLRQVGPSMAAPFMSSGVTAVLAIEARGFIVGPHGPEDRVLLVDDWVETGHQLAAVAELAEECGATVVGTSVVVTELAESQHPFGEIHALVQASDLE